jgi:Ser-tRNA(Ala) deacylase AlaX
MTVSDEAKPVSAVVEGTKKLYLEDSSLFECEAVVIGTTTLDDGLTELILDQTCLYPGGGGQAHDLGVISWDGGKLLLTEISKGDDGRIFHRGQLEGELPQAGAVVRCYVDKDRRLLNSRLHCAGHLIDYAVRKLGMPWKPGRGAHYPHMSFVEYEGEFNAEEAETLRRDIENAVNTFIGHGGTVGVRSVPSEEARSLSEYIPEAVLEKYQNVHLATYPDNFNVCCGGTHVAELGQVGEVSITKIKRKDRGNRVSYTLADIKE